MASDNNITLVGNITDDPELRFTPSGAAVANFTVAVNRRINKDGQWEDKLDGFFRCNCWRDMAQNVAESLSKGSRVVVVVVCSSVSGRTRTATSVRPSRSRSTRSGHPFAGRPRRFRSRRSGSGGGAGKGR